jgi:hypothetical protein
MAPNARRLRAGVLEIDGRSSHFDSRVIPAEERNFPTDDENPTDRAPSSSAAPTMGGDIAGSGPEPGDSPVLSATHGAARIASEEHVQDVDRQASGT